MVNPPSHGGPVRRRPLHSGRPNFVHGRTTERTLVDLSIVPSAVVATLGLLVSSNALADPILLSPDSSPADQALAGLGDGDDRWR